MSWLPAVPAYVTSNVAIKKIGGEKKEKKREKKEKRKKKAKLSGKLITPGNHLPPGGSRRYIHIRENLTFVLEILIVTQKQNYRNTKISMFK